MSVRAKPEIVPPLCEKLSFTIRLPSPASVREETLSDVALSPPFALRVPPETVTVALTDEGSATVSVPPLKIRLALLVSDLMACVPLDSVTGDASVPITTLSLAPGSASPLQLAGEVQRKSPAPPSQRNPPNVPVRLKAVAP